MNLPQDWATILSKSTAAPWYPALEDFVRSERQTATVYPPEEEVFTAFHLTPFQNVRVLLLGQDPYHGAGQAHGLSFSVKPGVAKPPSLVNMFKELQSDLGIAPPKHGNLEAWARQGVMMLNAVLTVREKEPNSHAGKGWEKFTDAVIDSLNQRREPVVFVLWGGYAKKKSKRITGAQHRVLEGVHPSPLSASAGFFGSKPYSNINRLLQEVGQTSIDWKL